MAAAGKGVPTAIESEAEPLERFHPLIQRWFEARFAAPTAAQASGWPEIACRRDTLICAPTGSGKTLAAFLAGLDTLLRRGEAGELEPAVSILYVSPLKALASDIHRNLEEPLEELKGLALEEGRVWPELSLATRHGDTPAKERQAILRRPPHILITTPESLHLMLTAERSREILRSVDTLIVDEIHALVRDKRGSHLALSLARLDHIAASRPVRIGLSATQKPLDEIGAFLVGSERLAADGTPQCSVIDCGHQRHLELSIEVPPSELGAVASTEQWGEIFDRLAILIAAHRTTLIFVNTRRLAERVAHQLVERVGADHVASHHGSLSRERRQRLEARLKGGELRALVATASLELGIDIGSIDLVCQLGAPGSIATFLQRVGRSGHALGLVPRGRLFPTSRDELLTCCALVRAVRRGCLDRIHQPEAPLDVLAQQIVSECACEPWSEGKLFDLVRRATPYRNLPRRDFDQVVEMLSEGIGSSAGGAPPLLHRDRIGGVLRARRGARLKALTGGGTIPETGDFAVIAEPGGTRVGTLNEDFAIESMNGDVFLLGTTSWRIRRVENGVVRVEDAGGALPTVPFWLGEAPGRSPELSEEVGRLRRWIADELDRSARGRGESSDRPGAGGLLDELVRACAVAPSGADQIVAYLTAAGASLGVVPSHLDVVFERFFDEAGGQQLVIHAPFGARINRAWGLALRKRFCVRFDFELQAAATDDAIVLSIGPGQSFPLEEAFTYLHSSNAEKSLRQAILYSPIWPLRWRWNATRALAVPRRRGGRKVPPNVQRMIAEDLLAAVFPQQVGCQENLSGPLQVPVHPLTDQTVHDCLHEALDLDGLVAVLERIEAGEIRLHARDTVEPSPLAAEVLNAKPYAFLDDAPLEERRARAVMLRRTLPEDARDLGALDAGAIERVRQEVWPSPRDAEEVHDALLRWVVVRGSEISAWDSLLAELVAAGRALSVLGNGVPCWIAAESWPLARLLFGDELEACEEVELPPGAAIEVGDRDEARQRLLRGHTETLGPVTAGRLSRATALEAADLERGLGQLEADGHVLRGRFEGGSEEREYCDRRLLSRIHRYTLDRLRREIEPVTAQDFMRFLLRWQYLEAGSQPEGKAGLRAVLDRLAGFEAPACSWEEDLLAVRVRNFDPAWLDELCLTGEVTWARLAAARSTHAPSRSRRLPISLLPRQDLPVLQAAARPGISAALISGETPDAVADPSSAADQTLEQLRRSGPRFFDELVRGGGRSAREVEGDLRELVARGLVHADGFEGLRRLATGRRRPRRWQEIRGAFGTLGAAGRWASLDLPSDSFHYGRELDEVAERLAGLLLERYGVVFRELMTRERWGLPWREVLKALRRLEARGLIRGGRFVAGVVGEQFASNEALTELRATRRRPHSGTVVELSTVDPCNLVGVVLPGAKIPARRGHSLVLRDGVLPPVAEEAAS